MARQGQIIERDNGYLLRWYAGRRDGRRVYLSETFKGGKRAAEKRLREILGDKDRGVRPETQSLDGFLDDYLKLTEGEKRPRTVTHYRQTLDRYIRPTLGAKPVHKVMPIDIENVVYELKKTLSPASVSNVLAVLSSAMRWGVERRLLAFNPCENVSRPKSDRTETTFLDADQRARFLGAIRGTRYEAAWVLLLGTGLRPSEAWGLQWDAVDLDAGTLEVNQALVKGGAGWKVSPPKTQSGRRTIRLPGSVVDALRTHQTRQKREQLQRGPAYHALNFVFTTRDGTPVSHRNMASRHFKPLLAKAGLSADIPMYSLRHTAATAMLDAQVNTVAVGSVLGHRDARMVEQVYGHASEKATIDARDALEGAFRTPSENCGASE